MDVQEREFHRCVAVTQLLNDPISRRIYHVVLSATQADPRGVYIQDIEEGERFNLHAEAVAAFKEHRDEYVKLLSDALPPGVLRLEPKPKRSILAPEPEPDHKGVTGKKYVVITPQEARTYSIYLAKKREAEATGAQLRISG